MDTIWYNIWIYFPIVLYKDYNSMHLFKYRTFPHDRIATSPPNTLISGQGTTVEVSPCQHCEGWAKSENPVLQLRYRNCALDITGLYTSHNNYLHKIQVVSGNSMVRHDSCRISQYGVFYLFNFYFDQGNATMWHIDQVNYFQNKKTYWIKVVKNIFPYFVCRPVSGNFQKQWY